MEVKKGKEENFIDNIDISKKDLDEVLFEYENEQLIWYLDELNSIISQMNTELTEEQRFRLNKLAKILINYFREFIHDENEKIRKYCELGIVNIYKLFPEFDSGQIEA
ncbi:MAG: hypothetical protein ACTSRZ_04035 [Promethearchaeota archaeon]